MHTRPLLILALIGTTAAFADPAIIEWDPARRLSWDDFAGSVPRSTDEKRVAATTASISWSYEFSVALSGSTCEFTITEIDSAARFHPGSSWVRTGHRNSAVLRHEQGHFDIARIYREEFNVATRDLVESRHACRGHSKRRATRNANEAIAELIGAIYASVWSRYRTEQETYDRETQHGTDAAAQTRWTDRISARLRTETEP